MNEQRFSPSGKLLRKLLSLKWIANLSVIITFALFVFVAAHRTELVAPTHRHNRLLDLRAGQRASQMAGVSYSMKQKTVVLTLSSVAEYGPKNMPLYRELEQFVHENPEKYQFVVVGPETPAMLKQYLDSNGLRPDVIVSDTNPSSGIHVAPVVALIGADSHVLKVWTGVLSTDEEREVIEAILRE